MDAAAAASRFNFSVVTVLPQWRSRQSNIFTSCSPWQSPKEHKLLDDTLIIFRVFRLKHTYYYIRTSIRFGTTITTINSQHSNSRVVLLTSFLWLSYRYLSIIQEPPPQRSPHLVNNKPALLLRPIRSPGYYCTYYCSSWPTVHCIKSSGHILLRVGSQTTISSTAIVVKRPRLVGWSSNHFRLA